MTTPPGDPASRLPREAAFWSYREKLYFLSRYYRLNMFDLARDVLGFDLIPESHRRWEKYLTAHIDFQHLRERTEGQIILLLEMPRESYKSTFFTVTGSIFALLNDPNLAILITSAATTNSRGWLSVIQKKMESEIFTSLFGSLKMPYEWRDSDITLSTRTKHRAEPSILCAGKDSTVTAKHFDIIFGDDLVNQNDRDSDAERTGTIKYIDDLVDLAAKPYGVIVFVGTTWHFNDAHQYIEKTLNPKLREQGKREVIIYKEPVYEDRVGGRVYLFPELYPASRCEEIRAKKSDLANFAANYLLKPLHPEKQIFKPEILKFFNYRSDLPKVRKICVHIDPAGGSGKGDYTALVVVGLRPEDNRALVLDAWIEQLAPSQREEAAYVLWVYYSALRWKENPADPREAPQPLEQSWQIETAANQDEVRRSLVGFMCERKKVADFPLQGKDRVANKNAKITNLELPISNGTLLFRDDWETAPHGYRLLIEQLFSFPLGHDDGPDALKEAFDLSQETGPQVSVF
jgi:predicted phage terminase large subunit-like protein